MISFLKAGTWVALALVDAVEKKQPKFKILRVNDGQGWRSLLRSGNCSSVFPRALVEQCCHSVSCSQCSRGESRRSSAAVATSAPPATAGATVAQVVLFGGVQSPAVPLGQWGRWAGGMSSSHWLRTGYWKLHKTWCGPLCVYLLPYLSLDCQQHWEPLTWSARISFDRKILSSDIILTAKPLLLWLFQWHVWYFEVFCCKK